MARKLRLQYEGAIYHVTVRGNGRRRIFLDDRDRERFLRRLGESADLYEVRIYLFALMQNHVHILVQTPQANIGRCMQSLLTGYTVYFNRRHSTCGHLLQGRYGAQLVQGDTCLLRLSRYIHLNPVRTRETRDEALEERRRRLRAYQWSSYCGYIDEKQAGEMVEYGPILAMVEQAPPDRRREYRRYVEAGLASDDEEFHQLMKAAPRAVGDADFRRWVDSQYRRLGEAAASNEDVSLRREAVIHDPERIVPLVADAFSLSPEDMRRTLRKSAARPVAAYLLCKYAGLTQRAAAQRLGYGTGAAVSMQLKRLKSDVRSNARTAAMITELAARIAASARSQQGA